MIQPAAVETAVRVLEMTEQEVLANCEELAGDDLVRFWSTTRGGGEILVARDGSYLLYGSTIDPTFALREFLAGRRTTD
jgi:hypothetical protein